MTEAQIRAEARLIEHRKKWAHLPDGSVMTRQRRRQAERKAAKAYRVTEAEAGRLKMKALRQKAKA